MIEVTESVLEVVVLVSTGGEGLAANNGHAVERAGALRLLVGDDSWVR